MAKKMAEDTPMLKQYFEIKSQYPEAILLYRVGDFYETYGEDALTASRVLGIGCDIETAVGRMVNDSVISKAESTVIEVCAEFMTRFFAEKVGAFEGARLA